jgi:hypothetical protein
MVALAALVTAVVTTMMTALEAAMTIALWVVMPTTPEEMLIMTVTSTLSKHQSKWTVKPM